MKLDAREAVKMCLCGTISGQLVGSYGSASTGWLYGFMNSAVASFVDLVTEIVGTILLLYTIWWLINTVAAIGRSSQGGTGTSPTSN